MDRRRIIILAASLVLVAPLIYLLIPARASPSDRLMDEIETKFSAQVPGAKLSNFGRWYYYRDDHTVIGFYEATRAEPAIPIEAGRRWVSEKDAPGGDDLPCYYYYELWFDLPTRKLSVHCGSDGMLDHGPPPPGLG